MNNVSIMGRITHSIELNSLQTGKSIVKFDIAVDRPYQREKTDFFHIVAFDKTADIIHLYFGKGQLIAIEGRLQVDNYTDRNGVKKEKVEIVADRVTFCGEKKNENKPTQKPNLNITKEDAEYQEEIIGDDGDLPF